MNTEEIIADLKQFIVATVSQATTDIRSDVLGLKSDVLGLKSDVGELRSDIRVIDVKVDEVQAAIAEALTTNNDVAAHDFADHERRLLRLEHRRAA